MVTQKDSQRWESVFEVAFWCLFFVVTMAICAFFATCELVKKLFWPLVAIVLAVCVVIGICQRCSAQETVGAQRTEEKWFVSVVGLQGCRPCAKLDRDLRSNPRLRSTIGAQSVSHWTYGTQECADHFRNIELKQFPTIVFQAPGSDKPYIVTGYSEPEELIQAFERCKAEHGAQSVEKEVKPRDHPGLQEASGRLVNKFNPLATVVERLKNNTFWTGVGFVIGLIFGISLQSIGQKIQES